MIELLRKVSAGKGFGRPQREPAKGGGIAASSLCIG